MAGRGPAPQSPRAPSLTARRVQTQLWLVGALAACAAGQAAFQLGGAVVDGLLLYAGGAYAFWRVLSRQPVGDAPLTIASRLRPAGRPLVAAALGGLAGACGLVAVVRVVQQDQPGLPVQALVLAAAVLWVAAGAAADGRSLLREAAEAGEGERQVPAYPHWILLALILLTAAAVRLGGLDLLPQGVWYDEAHIGNEAWSIATDPTFRPVYSQGTTTPAAYVYLVAAAEWLIGKTVFALRLTSALAGVGSTACAYLLARRLFDPRTALVAAGLFAVARWDVNFSRIAMQGATTPLLTLLAAAAAAWAVGTGRRSLYALAGVAMGALGWFYTANVVFIPALLLALGVLAARSPRAVWAQRNGLLFTVAGLLLVATPVVVETALRPDVVLDRPRAASVFQDAGSLDFGRTIAESARKHLLMLHVAGDRNGRHNLPNAPMLDPVTAVLSVLGTVAAVRAWRDSRSVLLLAWLPLMLLPGVLSVAFEAPQALRTVGAVAPAVLLAAMGLRAVVRTLDRSMTPVLLAAPMAAAGLFNLGTYFGPQAANPQVWEAFSMAPTLLARYMNQAPPDEQVYGSVHYANHPTVEFLAGRPSTELQLDKALPVRTLQPTTLFLAPEEAAYFDLAVALYPDGACRRLQATATSPPAAYRCTFSPEVLAASRGLPLRLTARTAPTGETPAAQSVVALTGEVVAPAAATGWTVIGSGSLLAPAQGEYQLAVTGATDLRASIDGREVPAGNGGAATLFLAEGLHALDLTGELGPGERATLRWRPPGANGLTPIPADALYHDPVRPMGLTATYRSGDTFEGTAAIQRLEPTPYVYYHILPLPLPFTVEWTGSLTVPTAGRYAFNAEAISTVEVALDGQRLLSTGDGQSGTDVAVELPAGIHRLTVRHRATAGYAHAYLQWRPPGATSFDRIPPALLRPW